MEPPSASSIQPSAARATTSPVWCLPTQDMAAALRSQAVGTQFPPRPFQEAAPRKDRGGGNPGLAGSPRPEDPQGAPGPPPQPPLPPSPHGQLRHSRPSTQLKARPTWAQSTRPEVDGGRCCCASFSLWPHGPYQGCWLCAASLGSGLPEEPETHSLSCRQAEGPDSQPHPPLHPHSPSAALLGPGSLRRREGRGWAGASCPQPQPAPQTPAHRPAAPPCGPGHDSWRSGLPCPPLPAPGWPRLRGGRGGASPWSRSRGAPWQCSWRGHRTGRRGTSASAPSGHEPHTQNP